MNYKFVKIGIADAIRDHREVVVLHQYRNVINGI